jgi:hypothetical protein
VQQQAGAADGVGQQQIQVAGVLVGGDHASAGAGSVEGALSAGAPVTVAVGWALPWIGVTLLGFLVVDVILGAIARRRRHMLPVSPAPAGS